jgi:hypothetical protein
MAEYNGWTNYETWVVKLWMDNEEGTYEYWKEVTTTLPPTGPDGWQAGKYELAKILKVEHEEALPDLEGFAVDLLNAALGEVNWNEIAESLIGNLEEEGVEA